MAVQFESLRYPFVILLAVPLGIVGVVLGSVVTGTSISVLALIGAVMLAGIVVNNAIVLVDAINRRRRHGEALEEAIVGAGRERLRPILMTTATTVLALLPMALGLGAGDELRRPLAITVIGGLTVATLLTLVVIPCLYRATRTARGKRRRPPAWRSWMRRRRPDREAHRLAAGSARGHRDAAGLPDRARHRGHRLPSARLHARRARAGDRRPYVPFPGSHPLEGCARSSVRSRRRSRRSPT